jgi:hypothetical protein
VELEENLYHAFVQVQAGSKVSGEPYLLALHLKNLFEKYGYVIDTNGKRLGNDAGGA